MTKKLTGNTIILGSPDEEYVHIFWNTLDGIYELDSHQSKTYADAEKALIKACKDKERCEASSAYYLDYQNTLHFVNGKRKEDIDFPLQALVEEECAHVAQERFYPEKVISLEAYKAGIHGQY